MRSAPSAPAMLDVTISGMVFELTPSGRGTDGFPATVIWVDKDGFGDPPGLPTPGLPHPSGRRVVTIDGDTRFDIELVRR